MGNLINPFLVFSGLGMMLVGFFPLIYWWKEKDISFKFFGFGFIAWVAAVSIKALMDVSVTKGIYSWFSTFSNQVLVIGLTGLYVGLRTGILENVFPYLLMVKFRLKDMFFEETVAFGLGFGCLEAILLGFSSFINVLVFVLCPELLNLVPAPQRAIVLKQLSVSSLFIPAPVIERLFTIFVHVFSVLLVAASLHENKLSLFLVAVVYKTAVDGLIPFLQSCFNLQTLKGLYFVEAIVAIMGLIGLVGCYKLKSYFMGKENLEHFL